MKGGVELDLAVHLIDARGHAQAACGAHKEDGAAQGVSLAGAVDADGLLTESLRVVLLINGYVFLGPGYQIEEIFDFIAKLVAEKGFIGREPLVLDSRAHDIAAIEFSGVGGFCDIIHEHIEGDVAQVLLADDLEQPLCHDLVGALRQELLNCAVVSTPRFDRHCGFVGMSNGVFLRLATIVLFALLGCDHRRGEL